MKKLSGIILVIALGLGFAGCQSNTESNATVEVNETNVTDVNVTEVNATETNDTNVTK